MARRCNPRVTVLLAVGASLVSASTASAATLEVVDGTAVFTAAPGEANDVRAVTRFGVTQLTVTDGGAPLSAGAGCEALADGSVTCPEDPLALRPFLVRTGDRADTVLVDDNGFRLVTVQAGSGDDEVTVGSGVGSPAVLEGGSGDDSLTTNMNGNGPPVLRGGSGDDTLTMNETGGAQAYGGDGNDRIVYAATDFGFPVLLDGGNGNDTYAFVRNFLADAMVAGPGFDTLDERTASFAHLDFELSACPGCVARVIGTPGADRIVGDSRAQLILGGDGDDELDGGGGPDAIAGQAGDDTINARDRSIDAVSCGVGTDSVTANRFDLVSRRDCESVSRG
jgi:Ca2+-binding RTX toxin-like protein